MTARLTDQDWDIRQHIYQQIVACGIAPSIHETAKTFGISVDEARRAFHRLHRRRMIVLEAGTDDVRMAIPLSVVPTVHHVWIGDKLLYANCAWDSLGVVAMLDVDARIEAVGEDESDTVRYAVENGKLEAPDDLQIQFPLPLSRWFDNIVDT